MTRYRFGEHALDTRAGSLLQGDAPVPLQPLPFQLLQHLVEHPGELCTRDTLREVLWPGVFVTDNSLEQVVRRLRKALLPAKPIETVPRRGYRFTAEVEVQPERPASGNLRPGPGRFVGRADLLEELARRVAAGDRLVTLTGTGGIGKTTVARELARIVEVPGWFVDLSACAGRDDVVRTTARALDVALEDSDQAGQVGLALGRLGRALVVLDNVEQVAAATRDLVSRWVAQAPAATVLVTSRIVLDLVGERTVAVGPLTPAEGAALFGDRAGCEVDDDVRRLVEALDGLPLAIELAARRARVLSPRGLLDRLEDRFSLLTDRSSDRPERHRSLEAVLITSWELLQRDEQRALVQLTPFEGAFTLAAAEAVLDDPGSAIDVLQSLVDQSLVDAHPPRFALLVTIRDWVRGRSDPAELRAAEARHGRWCASDDGASIEDRVAAARRAADRGDIEVAAPCALAAAAALTRSSPTTSIEVLEAALAVDDGTHRMALLNPLIPLLIDDRPDDALRAIDEATVHAREQGDLLSVAILEVDRGDVLRLQGHLDRAEATLEGAVSALRTLGDRYHEGLALMRLGSVLAHRDEPARAIELHQRALALFREIGHAGGITNALSNLAMEVENSGDLERAEALHREALASSREQAYRTSEASILGNLVVCLVRSGRLDEALEMQREALALVRALGQRRLEALQLGNLGELHLERGEHDEAAARLAEALELSRRWDGPVGVAYIQLALARLYREQGRREAAAAALAEARVAVEAFGEERLLVGVLAEADAQARAGWG